MARSHRNITLLIFIITEFVIVSCFEPQNKICNFFEHSIIPYSGFKLNKNYEVRCSSPPVLPFASLSHCDQGRLEYERITRTGVESGINWAQPMCLVIPERMRMRLDNKRRRQNRQNRGLDINSSSAKKKMSASGSAPEVGLKNIPSLPHSVKLLKNSKFLNKVKENIGVESSTGGDSCGQPWKKYLNYFYDRLGFLEYHFPDVSSSNGIDKITPLNYTGFTEEDANSVVCYKFARRKKYALRESSLFAPFAWVGGIFQCDVSNENRWGYLRHIQDSGLEEPFNIECDSANTFPVGPLIAEGLAHQWRSRVGMGATTLRVPFLYSPGILDWRFDATNDGLDLNRQRMIYKEHINKASNDDINYDVWWKEIDINENYNYTETDIDIINKTASKTADLIKEFEHRFPRKVLKDWGLGIPFLGTDDLSIVHHEEKLFHIFSKLKKPATILRFTEAIQSLWDDMTLSSA